MPPFATGVLLLFLAEKQVENIPGKRRILAVKLAVAAAVAAHHIEALVLHIQHP